MRKEASPVRLYHGSNVEVREPRLLRKYRDLDFGRGFYVTSDIRQARTWAIRTARIRGAGNPTVTVYDLDESELADLAVLRFAEPNERWLKFVAAHRKGEVMDDMWDIVRGPVADDRTVGVLLMYLDGYLTEQEAIRRLLPEKLSDQIVFKSPQALERLHYVEVLSL